MKKRKRKSEVESAADLLIGFVNVLDYTFTRLTGKPIKSWLEEFQRQPRELPPGSAETTSEVEMPLADAYAALGLARDAPIEEIKRRYRNLARLFHPDSPGGYVEAMRLLNNAYDRIKKEKGIK